MTDPEFLAISEKDIFEEARDRLRIANDAESDNRTKAKYDLRFREGEQWDMDSAMPSTSMQSVQLTVNLTDATCVRVINNIKQQRPRGKCHPVSDGASIEVAEVINGIGRHVEYRSDASVAYDNAADHAVTMGWGYIRLVSEYVAPDSFDQDIRILPIFNPFMVYMDPSAMMPTGQDAQWCLITSRMKRTEFRRMYPNAENAEWKDLDIEYVGEWERKEDILLGEYFRVSDAKDKLYLLRDRTGGEFTRFKDDMPPAQMLADAGISVVAERESSRRRVEWFRLNGTKVIDRKVIPGEFIPIVRCQGNARDIDGEVRRRGMVRSLIDPARMVNYSEVAKIKRLGLTPQSPWLVAEGQIDGHEEEWARANLEPVPYLTYKPVTVQTDNGEVALPPPNRLPPAQVEAGFTELAQGMRANLMTVAGMPNEPGADARGEVVSGRAIAKRQFLSDQSHYQYYDNLTLAIAHVWRIMLGWIPYYYNTQRVQRIIGEDHTPQMVTINQKVTEDGVSRVVNDLSVGRYDVVMDTGPGYETKREEGSAALMDLLGTPIGQEVAQVGADLVVRSVDAPYMQDLADRLASRTPDGLKKLMEQLPDRAKAIVQQLAGQNQQLQQALQAAQMEIKTGMDKERIKSMTKIHDTQVRAETAAHDRELESQTRIAVAEIGGAVQLLNSRAESERNQAAADEIIRKGETVERKE